MDRSRSELLKAINDPRWIALVGVLGLAALLVYLLGTTLVPIVVALVLAYFLDGGVTLLMRRNVGRRLAVTLVYALFLLLYLVGLLGPLQVAVQQGMRLAAVLPALVDKTKALLGSANVPPLVYQLLPDAHGQLATWLGENLRAYGEGLLSHTFAGISGATSGLLYVVLIPLLVFFFLKDKDRLRRGMARVLPRNRELLERVWREMEVRMANYVRGKVWEILIVGVVTWVVFRLLGFQYSEIISVISGISVIIPYVGAVAVAVPVFLLALVQWGLSYQLAALLGAYVLIQFVDGNVLVPMVFSDAVQLSPTVILLAILVFGSLWGVWGVFFAIPLATLTKALLTTWVEYRDASQ